MKKQLLSELYNLKNLLDEKPREPSKKLREYGYGAVDLRAKSIERAKANILKTAFAVNTDQRQLMIEILNLAQDPEKNLMQLIELADKLEVKEDKKLGLKIPQNLPAAVRADMAADIREVEKAFNSGCYRAATILCGRLLETSLHRKYYEATGNDILEKNPGIGLGKLIAKMAEKNIQFDPGLTQQIHLINQVRIHSVHVKKESFYPSQQQAYAMILYTLDVIEKMF